jgi:predicted MFS family arabinose efflux permease
MLERIPEGERPSHLAWYNLALNAAILLGSMLGPLFAQQVGLATALGVTAVCRFGAALAVRRWG